MKKFFSIILSISMLLSLSVLSYASSVVEQSDESIQDDVCEAAAIMPRQACEVCYGFAVSVCLGDCSVTENTNTHNFGNCTRTYKSSSMVYWCQDCGHTQDMMSGHLCKIYHSSSSCKTQDVCAISGL